MVTLYSPASNLSFLNPFLEVKIGETVLRRRPTPQFLPTALFVQCIALFYMPKLYTIPKHYALLMLTAQSSTLSITHTSRRSQFGDFTSGMCLGRCSYAHNRPNKGSRTHLRTFRELFLASWSPSSFKSHSQFFFPNSQAVKGSHTSDLHFLLRTVLEHCASPACTRSVTTKPPLQRKCRGRTRAGLKTRGKRTA
ncbi:hypothetical protein K443DRAFT_112899 [Laccaria amethystina LaAM-08-1]|uniref:Uncharacterized protein n=1 Tax=Laccaria amethystina LaAM-08-1 TaxID=1095629 RepID=A0A0C9WPJ9_9AGAR|nr:hypothetical protein K443DRAFT_112899 [Laccaria amethystina LaAM-08-1]